MKDSFWEILGGRRLSDFGTFWICILKPIFFIIVTITEILKKEDYFFIFLQGYTYRHIYCRDRPRFFDQVGHQTTYASIGYKHFFTK